METNNQRIQELASAARRERIMKVLSHLTNWEDVRDILNKVRKEGFLDFINTRFGNMESAARAAIMLDFSIEMNNSYNPNSILFYDSKNALTENYPPISGIVFPENTIIEYAPLFDEQETSIDKDIPWLKLYMDKHNTESIYGFMPPGTYVHKKDLFLNEFGIAEVIDGKINIIKEFLTDPLTDGRIRLKPESSIIDDIYGGIVFYQDGSSSVLDFNQLKETIQQESLDPNIKYITGSNFLLTRHPDENGIDNLRNIISKNAEWQKIRTYNLLLHFRTSRGTRVGYLNINFGLLEKSIDVIENLAQSIDCNDWSMSIGEYAAGGVSLLNNELVRRDIMVGEGDEGDFLITSKNIYTYSHGYNSPRDYIIFTKK